MLTKIDDEIIHKTQWIVRQIELFTDITRKEILNFFLLVLKWLILAFVIIAGIEFTADQYFLAALNLFTSSGFLLQQIDIKKIASQEQKIALPEEITTRRILRIIFLVITIVCTPYIVIFIFYGKSDLPTTIAMIQFAIFYTITILEYLLCTISLPPGEKKQYELEKEMKNMQVSMT